MRTDIEQISRSQPQNAGTMSAIPATISRAVQALTGPRYADFALELQPPTQTEIAAAIQALPAVEQAAASVLPDVLKSWLRALSEALPVGSVASDPSRLVNAVRAICEACGEFPAACFTPKTRGEVLRRCRFFPSAAELAEIIQPIADRERAILSAVRSIATALPAPPSQARRDTPEEIAACIARNATVIQALKAPAGAQESEPLATKCLSPLQLALADRAQGIPVTRPSEVAALVEYDALVAR